MHKISALVLPFVALAAANATAQELKPWRHGIVEAKSDSGFIMMVDKGGFAQKRGLKIETSQMKAGATVMRALIAGELDSVEMGAAEAIVAAAHGAAVKIVGCSWPGLPQVVLSKAEIATPADLKGRTVAISAPGSLPDLLFRAVLDTYKMSPDDVRLASLGADLDRYKSMVAGVSDAAVVSNEFQPIMPPQYKVLVSGHAVLPNFMRVCITMNSKVLAERRDDAARFLAAEIDAMRYAVGHRSDVAKLTREMTGAKGDDPRPEFIFDQAVSDRQVDPDLNIPADKIDWMQAQFVKSGVLPHAVETAKIIDPDLLAKALALIGK